MRWIEEKMKSEFQQAKTEEAVGYQVEMFSRQLEHTRLKFGSNFRRKMNANVALIHTEKIVQLLSSAVAAFGSSIL